MAEGPRQVMQEETQELGGRTLHSSSKVETAQVSVGGWKDKHNVPTLASEILFSRQQE